MRKVRIATVSFLMDEAPHTVEGNLERAVEYIARAAEQKPDLILLPETVTTNKVKGDLAFDQYPGEWTLLFQQQAKKHSVNLIAPYYVGTAEGKFNQATVIDRNGGVVGYYRKVQPTGSEAKFVVPGDALPVFELDFGKIAVMICMDIYFAEIVRIYAMKGAEILLWPTVTHGPTQQGLEMQVRTRALDNSLVIVESNLATTPPYAPYAGKFYPGNARIIDYNGDIIASTGRRDGIATAEVDLDERRKTAGCFLIQSPDDTRKDIESLVRLDLYAKEYAQLAKDQQRYYDSL